MKKKKLFKPVMSSLLIGTMISGIFALSANASLIEFDSTKIDSGLQGLLGTVSDDEKVSVSLWVDDIDYDDIKAAVKVDLRNDVESGELSASAIDCVFLDESELNNPANYQEFLNDTADISQSEIETVILSEREIVKEKMSVNNQNIYSKLSDDLGGYEPEVILMSSYAPNMDLWLTKEQIYELSLSSYVEEIYFVNPEAEFASSSVETDDDELDDDYPLDVSYFDVTGLSTGRDTYGLSGTGMKVGILESEYLPDLSYFDNCNITNVTGSFEQSHFHGTRVALMLVGNSERYVGAIPDAQLYCSAIGGIEAREARINELLECGVTAINMSCSLVDSEYEYNTYGTLSRYIDYISRHYNVTFIMSSGNTQGLGVVASNMAYNAIIVGNCKNNGELYNESSYNFTNDTAYKPDIVAPGYRIDTPAGQMTGTSASAPLVTSAVVQLTQAIPALTGKSELIKSILMSSSKITSYMNQSDVITPTTTASNRISLSKQYGAGMLSLTNAYDLAYINNNYLSGIFSNSQSATTWNVNIENAIGKTLRFSANWDKYNTSTESINLDSLSLEITSPNGTKYTSTYLFDNKQMVSFNVTENGLYSVKLFRNYYSTSSQTVDFAISYSLQ